MTINLFLFANVIQSINSIIRFTAFFICFFIQSLGLIIFYRFSYYRTIIISLKSSVISSFISYSNTLVYFYYLFLYSISYSFILFIILLINYRSLFDYLISLLSSRLSYFNVFSLMCANDSSSSSNDNSDSQPSSSEESNDKSDPSTSNNKKVGGNSGSDDFKSEKYLCKRSSYRNQFIITKSLEESQGLGNGYYVFFKSSEIYFINFNGKSKVYIYYFGDSMTLSKNLVRSKHLSNNILILDSFPYLFTVSARCIHPLEVKISNGKISSLPVANKTDEYRELRERSRFNSDFKKVDLVFLNRCANPHRRNDLFSCYFTFNTYHVISNLSYCDKLSIDSLYDHYVLKYPKGSDSVNHLILDTYDRVALSVFDLQFIINMLNAKYNHLGIYFSCPAIRNSSIHLTSLLGVNYFILVIITSRNLLTVLELCRVNPLLLFDYQSEYVTINLYYHCEPIVFFVYVYNTVLSEEGAISLKKAEEDFVKSQMLRSDEFFGTSFTSSCVSFDRDSYCSYFGVCNDNILDFFKNKRKKQWGNLKEVYGGTRAFGRVVPTTEVVERFKLEGLPSNTAEFFSKK